MLTSTFIHIPGIGEAGERRLWRHGFLFWEDIMIAETGEVPLPLYRLKEALGDSERYLDAGDIGPFASALSSRLHWRFFPEFRHRAVYLDIETTGLGEPGDHITTIALYDGGRIRFYIYGINLDKFKHDITDYDLLITYNGKSFDLPFIERTLGVSLQQAHIDLRYLLRCLGYKGGLKGCERQMGIERGDLDGIDGYFAVLLWREYCCNHCPEALETLLAYNIEDVLNLEKLMVKAYNLSLRETPFAGVKDLPEVIEQVVSPFKPDMQLVRKIKEAFY
jgi:uncharacterized protein YprB with RNaseH-like and TPR domain